MSATELRARLDRGDDIFLVDVRTPSEQAIAHIEGARLLDAALQEEISASPAIAASCACVNRRPQPPRRRGARPLGFRDVYNLEGGIEAWSRDVDPEVPRY